MKYGKRIIIKAFRNHDKVKLLGIIKYELARKEKANTIQSIIVLIGLMYCTRFEEDQDIMTDEKIAFQFNTLRAMLSLPFPQVHHDIVAFEKSVKIKTSFGAIIQDFFKNKMPAVENHLLYNFSTQLFKKSNVHGYLIGGVIKRKNQILRKYENFSETWSRIILPGSAEDEFTIFHSGVIQGIMKGLYRGHINQFLKYGAWNAKEKTFLDSIASGLVSLKASQQNVFFQHFSAIFLAWAYCTDYMALRIYNKNIKKIAQMPRSELFEGIEHWTEKVGNALRSMILADNLVHEDIQACLESFFKIYIYKK